MRRTMVGAVAFVAMLATSVLQAHEGHLHKLMGTVTAVRTATNEVELSTKDGKTETFYVTADTKYLKGTQPAALTDVTVNTRVVVTTKVEGKKSIATEVKLGASTPGPAASSPR